LSGLVNHADLVFEGGLMVDWGRPSAAFARASEDFFAIHEEIKMI
jgi:hypothetical protein